MALSKTTRIRELNDAFRTTFTGGKVVMTSGVAAIPTPQLALVLAAVSSFKDFDESNDPHGEHDFGSFELAGGKFFWKIDYFSMT